MVRKVEEISGRRCSVCGAPATEDWQKYMAPRCTAHPHTATGRMVAGEEPVPTNPATGQPYFKVPAEGWVGKSRVEELEAAVRSSVEFLKAAPLATGVCCCGDSVEGHPSPMDCGHSPVDSGEYAIHSHVEGLEKVLARKDTYRTKDAEIAELRSALEPVIYVNNNGQLVSRVSDEQVEAVLGPHVDRIRNAMAWYTKDAEIAELRSALELARNGLAWYRDAYPEADSGADDEMMETIAVALGEAELTNEDGTPSPYSRG